MFINDFQSSNGYRLHQILHTLKSVHGTELDLDSSSDTDLAALGESSEIIKNSIVSESQFNTYNSNPEYAKHMLIMEAIRLYLLEIAPKRKPKHLRENAEVRIDKRNAATIGRWMMKFAETNSSKDDKILAVLNSFSRVGEDLTSIGSPFGPKTVDELIRGYKARVADEAGEDFDRRQARENLHALVLGQKMYNKHHQGLEEMNPAQAPGSQGNAAVQPGTVNVQKGNDKKTVQAAQLANLQKQGYAVVGELPVKEDDASGGADSELAALMKKYGVDPGMGDAATGSVMKEDWGSSDWTAVLRNMDNYLDKHGVNPDTIEAAATDAAEFYHDNMGYDDPEDAKDRIISMWMTRKGWKGMMESDAANPNYHKLAKEHAAAAKAAFDTEDEDDFAKHMDLSNYYKIKAGEKVPDQVVEPERFMGYVEKTYGEHLKESIRLAEANFDHDSYQASMARSELYRNTKYAMDLLKMIKPEDEIQPWISANLTKSAEYLDKVYHYLDYYKTFEPQQLPEDEDHDTTTGMALGETTGSTARQNLMHIVEYSTKLFSMIQPGQKLEGWVAMKLTTASDCVSSSKHYMEYQQFEKHAQDMLGNVEDMAEEGSKMKKKTVKESVGQMLMSMMLNEDQDLAQAQTLLAAKALSDDLQTMAEKIAKMSVEDLMPLVDTMKEQFGLEAAEGYNEMMKTSLEALLSGITDSKDTSDNAILQLQGGGVPSAAGDAEPQPGVTPAEPEGAAPEGEEAPTDELGAPELPADEEPLGRAKKDESVSTRGKPLSEAYINNSKDAINVLGNLRKMAKGAEMGQGKLNPNEVVNDLWDVMQWIEHNMSRSVNEAKKPMTAAQEKFFGKGKKKDAKKDDGKGKKDDKKPGNPFAKKDVKESKLTEKAPPSKQAEKWIKANKQRFVKQYGPEKGMQVLYAKAWKDFVPKSESHVKAVKMLEQSESNLAKLQKAFTAHKAQYARMLKEGQVDDPLKLGYGLEGEVMLDKMGGLDGMIGKLKEMIRSEMRTGVLEIMAEEARATKLAKLESARATAPYGVMWKSKEGSKQSKFFESEQLRKYWLDLNNNLTEQRLVNPNHFDSEINKLVSKKG